MELTYFGANCVRLETKKVAIVIDDNLASVGQKSITKADDISLVTNSSILETPETGRLHVTYPGEYEVSNISISGMPAHAHIDDEAAHDKAVIYHIAIDDLRVGVIGHVVANLNDDRLEQLGGVDLLIIPVGGNGYTLDGIEAAKLIKQIEPRLVLPTHYEQKGISYEVPQQPLQEALKSLGLDAPEAVAKLKLRAADIPEATTLVILERS